MWLKINDYYSLRPITQIKVYDCNDMETSRGERAHVAGYTKAHTDAARFANNDLNRLSANGVDLLEIAEQYQ